MEEVDKLFEQASLRWYAYGILFGKYKGSSGTAFATVIISVYVDRWTAIQRKFEGPTLALVMDEIKKWLADPSYVQNAYAAVPVSKPKRTPGNIDKSATLF
jgi:hypothetical protein